MFENVFKRFTDFDFICRVLLNSENPLSISFRVEETHMMSAQQIASEIVVKVCSQMKTLPRRLKVRAVQCAISKYPEM